MTKDRGWLGNRIFLSPRLFSFYPLFLLGWLFLFCGTTCVPAHNFQVSCGLYRADTCPTYASLLSRLLISRFREPFRDETASTSRPSKTIDRAIAPSTVAPCHGKVKPGKLLFPEQILLLRFLRKQRERGREREKRDTKNETRNDPIPESIKKSSNEYR